MNSASKPTSSHAMGLFYPDNPKRMVRLHQLVDSVTNMEADLKSIGKQMDDNNTQYRPAINALLKAHGMASVDDVIKDAASKMTSDERKVFETLIKTIQDSKTGFDTMYFISSLLLAPAGAVLTGKAAISIACWGSHMINLKSLVNFFSAAEGGEAAAAAAAAEIAAEAAEAAEALEGVTEAAEAAEVAAEVGEVTAIVAEVSVFLDVLAGIGLVVGLIAGIIEIFEGAEQKRKLIDAIHRLQPARLTTASFRKQGTNVLDQLMMLSLYLDASPGGSDPDPDTVAKFAERIVSAISQENSKIDLNNLEWELEAQDRQASDFYGGADLSHDAVIAATSND